MTEELLAGRYQLEQELGRGGMATVFLARDLRLSRRVAVKVMHPGGDARRTERFRREAELAASLKHPNVLEVHDFGEDAVRGPFLVCEWVQGESLRELARRLAPVPPEVAAVLGWELARALEAAHARGVVHRDVKPENVLVAKGGPLKLADFGIAALADQERLTSTGAITGSLAYMAPERIDTGAWSPASDVYAVGVILFELCTGTTPHAGQGSAHLAVSVMTRNAPALCEAAPGTPEPLGALVDRCLARDSRERPVDGAELAACLEAVVRQLAGPPAEASRRFFLEPEAEAARWREVRFQRLLDGGRALLSKGEGAKAARLLNEALTLRPGSSDVLALLRVRPKAGRAKVLGGGAAVVGLLGTLAVWGWSAREPAATNPSVQAAQDSRLREPRVALQEATSDLAPSAPPTSSTEAAREQPTTPGAPRSTATEAARGEPPTPNALRASLEEPASGERSTPNAPRSTLEIASRAPSTPSAPRSTPTENTSAGTSRTSPKRASGEASSQRTPLPSGAQASTHARPASPRPPLTGTPPPVEAPESTPRNTASPRLESAPSEAQGYATLTVVTRPWAEVFVDGQSRGYTPRVRALRLSPGTHRLRFDNPLCDALEEDLHVAAGETVSREITLQVRKAEVTLLASQGARVFVDGTEVGMAPLPGPVKLTHGRHVLSARGRTGDVIRKEVDVVAGERTEVVLGSQP